MIYLPVISIIHITLIFALFVCPSPSAVVAITLLLFNFFSLFIILNFFPFSIMALSPFLSPTFYVTGEWMRSN